jgi:hypothetical protein
MHFLDQPVPAFRTDVGYRLFFKTNQSRTKQKNKHTPKKTYQQDSPMFYPRCLPINFVNTEQIAKPIAPTRVFFLKKKQNNKSSGSKSKI